ncbi:hypothetical protein FA95DRAFT_1455530, partial [Auriscalpium vulgare]
YKLALPDTYPMHSIYEVGGIVRWRRNKRRRGNQVEYLVRWAGLGPEDDTWQTAADLRNAPEILRAY